MRDYPDQPMCPNCVTPWKCNGPHIPENSELAALRDKYATLEEARDAEMLKVANRDAEIAELRIQNEGLKDELCEAEVRLVGLRTKLEEVERKLAQARAEGMEEAAKVCEEDESGRDGGGYFADAIRSAIEKEQG